MLHTILRFWPLIVDLWENQSSVIAFFVKAAFFLFVGDVPEIALSLPFGIVAAWTPFFLVHFDFWYGDQSHMIPTEDDSRQVVLEELPRAPQIDMPRPVRGESRKELQKAKAKAKAARKARRRNRR